jgi:hypothetical protein
MIMKIKNIFAAGLFCCIAAAFTACSSDDDPFFTASENDTPRILNTDIPEGKAGEPGVIAIIERTENFTFEVMVTPVAYTTVTWFIDDEQVAEGLKIDVPVLAGDHILKIVATTTKGLSTSRTCKLTVRPVTGDPELATDAKSRWLTIGSTKTIDCANVSSVAKVFIGKTEATNVSYANNQLTFDVPAMEEGEYMIAIQDAEGMKYGCGTVTVSKDEYVAPGVTETVLWEGSFDVTWGTPFDGLKSELINYAKPGAILRAYVTGEGQGCAASAWWRNIVTGYSDDDEGRGDTMISGEMVLEYTLTELSIELLQTQDGFLMVGDGYTLTKITLVTNDGPVETALWEGSFDVTWGTPFDGLKTELINHVKVGTILRAYVNGEGQGCAASAWWRNIVTGYSDDDEGRGDTMISGEMVLEYTLNETSIELLQTQDGFLMVGDGYTLTKITVE